MPKNKRESLIFTVLMCFVMVFWMSLYNISLQTKELSFQVIQKGWLGLPLAYIIAICCDWFFVSKLAKTIAFRFFIQPSSSEIKKALTVSTCMVIPMVIIMSLYGAFEACTHTGTWSNIGMIWLMNIPVNFIMALPFQLLIAGPLVRFVFRKAFPEGCIVM